MVGERVAVATASPWTRSIPWWGIGLGSPLLLFLAARMASRITGQTVPAWSSLGHVNFLPDLGVAAWGLWLATSGVGEELFAWFERGAHFYVCGDAKRMAKDVEAAVRDVAVAHGGMSAEAATAWLNELKAAGRYQADVY